MLKNSFVTTETKPLIGVENLGTEPTKNNKWQGLLKEVLNTMHIIKIPVNNCYLCF